MMGTLPPHIKFQASVVVDINGVVQTPWSYNHPRPVDMLATVAALDVLKEEILKFIRAGDVKTSVQNNNNQPPEDYEQNGGR